MTRLNKLRSKRQRRKRGRARQMRLWRKTGKRGHRRMAGKHGRAMKFLRRLIRREKARKPKQPRIFAGLVADSKVAYREHIPAWVTGHYTAGPRDTSDEHALQLCKSYDAQHRSQGWRMIGYHYCVTRAGSIICLRPVGEIGAHVLNHNTGNVGVMVHGTLGDTWTEPQRLAYIWLLENAHTDALPAAHRSPVDLSKLPRRGHNDWMATSCPGDFKAGFLNPYR